VPQRNAPLHGFDNPGVAAEISTAASRVAERLGPGGEPRQALDGAMAEMCAIFDAKSLVFIARDQWYGRVYRSATRTGGPAAATTDGDIETVDELTYFFPVPSDTWFATRGAGRGRVEAYHLDTNGRSRKSAVALPKRFLSAHRFRTVLVLSAEGAEQAAYRVFLFDARVGAHALRMLQAISRQVGPALYSVEMLARLQSRVGAAERARVARDLHDGIIQSLIGLEMQVEVWRRAAGPEETVRLGHIQNALRREVLELRDLIERMRRVSIDPNRVLQYLASTVERFQRDSGIEAQFVSEIDELSLSPRVCDELVRIVQEALVNVRKHSGARHVLVRVSVPDGYWKFEVDDDGRGFGFSGRHTQAELDVARKGPVIIKERVRAIGGLLAVESDPGRGARVEVWLPRQQRHG
jgi:signal transduction histidine kinase